MMQIILVFIGIMDKVDALIYIMEIHLIKCVLQNALLDTLLKIVLKCV